MLYTNCYLLWWALVSYDMYVQCIFTLKLATLDVKEQEESIRKST